MYTRSLTPGRRYLAADYPGYRRHDMKIKFRTTTSQGDPSTHMFKDGIEIFDVQEAKVDVQPGVKPIVTITLLHPADEVILNDADLVEA
jgi:hypothetical protein